VHQVVFSLHDYIEMHGKKKRNIKFNKTYVSLQSWEFSSLVRRLLVEFVKYDSMELVQTKTTQESILSRHADWILPTVW